MDSLDFVAQMLPFWIFGLMVLIALYFSSFRGLLSINWSIFAKWCVFVLIVSVVRYAAIRITATQVDIQDLVVSISWLPTWSTFFVPWEDLSHTVPLAIMAQALPNTYLGRVLASLVMIVLMINFGAGHLYQGVLPALFLTLYIPLTLKLGQKYGFGTIMLCHVVYDLSTVALIKHLI